MRAEGGGKKLLSRSANGWHSIAGFFRAESKKRQKCRIVHIVGYFRRKGCARAGMPANDYLNITPELVPIGIVTATLRRIN